MHRFKKLMPLVLLPTLISCTSLQTQSPVSLTPTPPPPSRGSSPTPTIEPSVPCSALKGLHLSVSDTLPTQEADAPIIHTVHVLCGVK